jgi:hypothetical protein
LTKHPSGQPAHSLSLCHIPPAAPSSPILPPLVNYPCQSWPLPPWSLYVCPALTSACARLIYAKGHPLTLFNNTGPSCHSHNQRQSEQHRSIPIVRSCHLKPETRSRETRKRRFQHTSRTSIGNTQRHFCCKKHYSFFRLNNHTAAHDEITKQPTEPSSNEPTPDLPLSRPESPKHHGRPPSHDPQINVRRPQSRPRRPRSNDRAPGARNNKTARIPLLPLQNTRPSIPRPPRPPHRQLLTTQILTRLIRTPRPQSTWRLRLPTTTLRMLRTLRRRPSSAATVPRHLLPRERRHPSQFRPAITGRIPTTTLPTARPTRLDAANAKKPRRSKLAGQHVQRSFRLHFPPT